jgi:hypothetical protein
MDLIFAEKMEVRATATLTNHYAAVSNIPAELF